MVLHSAYHDREHVEADSLVDVGGSPGADQGEDVEVQAEDADV